MLYVDLNVLMDYTELRWFDCYVDLNVLIDDSYC